MKENSIITIIFIVLILLLVGGGFVLGRASTLIKQPSTIVVWDEWQKCRDSGGEFHVSETATFKRVWCDSPKHELFDYSL